MVGEFNKLCESLKIDGTNSTGTKVYLDKLRTVKKYVKCRTLVPFIVVEALRESWIL